MKPTPLALLLVVLSAPPNAWAEVWPERAIRAVIPFGAGSATDVIPRIVFERMSAQLGQPIVVENRAGAGGTIGAAMVAKAKPDGYTLLTNSSAHTIAPSIYGNLAYHPANDFAAVGAMGSVPNVLIISPSKGIKTVSEFVARAKAKPGSFNFASVGVGSAVHLSAERFRVSAGYEAVHVPFKGGPEALTEVIAGRVDYYFCPIATALPHIKDGRLLALAVSSPMRAASLPDVPTTLEAGFPDSDYTFWIGTFAPAGTAPEIVQRLHREMQAAIKTPAVADRLVTLGVEAMPLTPAAFGGLVAKEVTTYAEFVRKAKMKVE
ncbi:MAG: tripartite tricarboxylate transporter substrate binding protein [Xanthobacteraceae bacterium]|nr:tripartite tricarboxylate transporter substrate binding protein [Xanthobacteraceae bacterium]